MTEEEAFKLAIANVAAFGDTDHAVGSSVLLPGQIAGKPQPSRQRRGVTPEQVSALRADCSRPSCAGLSSNLALKPAVLSVRAVS